MANPAKVPAVHEPLDVAVALLTLHGLEPTSSVESLSEGDFKEAQGGQTHDRDAQVGETHGKEI